MPTSATALLTVLPLVLDATDDVSQTSLESQLGLNLTLVHEKTEDEALYYINNDLSEEQIQQLASHPAVEAIEQSIEYEAFTSPNDPMYDKQWNMTAIGVDDIWTSSAGENVVVAVIDSGFYPGKDITPINIKEGISFVKGEKDVVDLAGHGTHVTGTIAQTTNNEFGVAGVAPNATILPIKALSKTGRGRSEWIAAAIDEAVDQGAHIINLSLGGPPSKVIRIAVEKALKQDVIIVAAAGNAGSSKVSSPANISGVIAVSATGPSNKLAPYSNYGQEISFAAPGGNTKTTGGGILQESVVNGSHSFLAFQGTSMATPHVSAALAVVLSEGAGTPQNAIETLRQTALDLGKKGKDERFGYGLIQVDKAVQHIHRMERGARSLLAGTVMFGFAFVAGFRLPLLLAVASAYLAGGIFFTSPEHWMQKSFLNWVEPVGVLAFLWYSSLPSLFLVAISVVYNHLRWIGCAFSVAMGIHLMFGALDHQLPLNALWLGIHSVVAILLGLFSALVNQMLREKK